MQRLVSHATSSHNYAFPYDFGKNTANVTNLKLLSVSSNKQMEL